MILIIMATNHEDSTLVSIPKTGEDQTNVDIDRLLQLFPPPWQCSRIVHPNLI